MKILSLELGHYKRFKLGQIKRFKITFNQIIQLILGTNGSGKSSLMEELSPLPAIANNYTKDGYKIIELTNNGHHYILSTRFSTKQPHSFKKNDVELNDGGTITIQKELVKQEFGITQEIFDLLLGNEKFHQMSPSRKREWFTNLGEASYEYSLGVYGRLCKRYRDTQGAINIAKKRLVIESAKLINEEEEKHYRIEVDELHRVLTSLIENRNTNLQPFNSIQSQYEETEFRLNEVSTALLGVRISKPNNFTIESDIDLEFEIRNMEQILKTSELIIQEKVKEYDLLEKSYSLMVKAGGAGIKELEERTKPIIKQQIAIRATQQLGLIFDKPEEVLNIIDTIEPILYDLLSDLPVNKDRQYSRLALDKEIEFQLKKQDEKKRLENDYNKFSAQKLHLEQHKKEGSIECPKCEHKWIRGYDENKYQYAIRALEELEQKITTVSKEIRSSEERVNFINEYARKYRDYLRTVESSKILQPFWDIVEHQSKITDAPRDILTMLGSLRLDLGREIEFQALEKEIADINELAKSIQLTEANNLEELAKKMSLAQDELGKLTRQFNQLKTNLTDYQNYRGQLKTIFTYNEEIKKLIKQFDSLKEQKIEVLRNNSINYCIRELQLALATKEKILLEFNVQKGIVNDIKNQIIKLQEDEEALKLLITNLSPTDGLIAEGLFGFIRTFVKQMNTIIRKTWSYPMEVVPCGINEDGGVELDYRFPLMVHTKDNVQPDVSKGSSGMKEVIDFSFVIIAMKYLGLSSAPIYLDEWGKTLDVQHKRASVESLKALLEQQHFTQLFLISHDFSQYTSLSNCEVCVLDPTNIVVPGSYNQHVEIE